MVAQTVQALPAVNWYAIRNASDPPIANPTGDIRAANKEAGQIYTKYDPFTTAGSAIATWAVLDTTFSNGHHLD